MRGVRPAAQTFTCEQPEHVLFGTARPDACRYARFMTTGHMSAPRWRWSLIGVWLALTCITFIASDSMAVRSWLLLLVFGLIPPAMLLWMWNDDRPVPIGSPRVRRKEV